MGRAGAEHRCAPSLETVQRGLRHGAALLQYSVVRGQLLAFVVQQSSLSCVMDMASIEDVRALQETWRFGLEGLKLYPVDRVEACLTAWCEDAQVHLRRMHDLLIAPLPVAERLKAGEGEVTGIDRLHIGLHPALSGVPFAALFDGANYLLEQCEIDYLSGALGASPQEQRMSTLLTVGFSDGGRIPFAVEEAERVATTMRDLPGLNELYLLVEEEATEQEFTRLSRDADLIHLATHAGFRPDNPLFSWVQLADARPTVADMYGLRLSGAPLVTLSACETALGGWRGGGLIGLGRALMAAGAGAVVASLWKVDDAASADLMGWFYSRLSEGEPVSAALRSAQVEALRRFQHPLYWAGYAAYVRANGNGAAQ